jgi:dihydroneopterin aldolase
LQVRALTLLLAGVASAAEAESAIASGADALDLRGPGEAALVAIARRVPTIVSPGALAPDLVAQARARIAAGAAFVKLPVDAESLLEIREALATLAPECALIGVFYADRAPDLDLLGTLRDLGFKGAMLDTVDARAGRLLAHMNIARLDAFCARCRVLGLIAILAGSLEPPDVPRLLLAAPDMIGFRVASRADLRHGGPDAAAARLIRNLVPRAGSGAARQDASEECDKIFVRDFGIEAKLGAYDYERGSAQRVVFTVEAAVRRVAGCADDMRMIFSYDIIMDAIRLIVGRGHVNFVETLAEGVAEIVLRHPRVARVQVRVEKLDVIAGAVGVEILRERRAAR